MNIKIKSAEVTDIPLIQELSRNIWKTHYITIISMEQINYMLDKMYAQKQLEEELNNPDYFYYLAFLNQKVCGYMAISKSNENEYLLHKFYILEEARFKGLGEKIFNLVFEKRNYSQIQLYVNRQNFKSVNFYFKLGFRISAVIDNHFGEGYYMNDFIMIKRK